MKVLAVSDHTLHSSHDLINIFNRCFLQPFNTCLKGGYQEPIYLPASVQCKYHQLCFREDYFASALHEI